MTAAEPASGADGPREPARGVMRACEVRSVEGAAFVTS